jgi:hypothetical protein
MIIGGPFVVRIAHPDVRISGEDDQMRDPGGGRGVEAGPDTSVMNAMTGSLMPLRAGDLTANLASEMALMAAIDARPFCIASVKAPGKIVLVNSQTVKLLSCALTKLLGRKIEVPLPPRCCTKPPLHCDQFFAAHRPVSRLASLGRGSCRSRRHIYFTTELSHHG